MFVAPRYSSENVLSCFLSEILKITTIRSENRSIPSQNKSSKL